MGKRHSVDYHRDSDTRRRLISYMGDKPNASVSPSKMTVPYSVPRNRTILYILAVILLVIGIAGLLW